MRRGEGGKTKPTRRRSCLVALLFLMLGLLLSVTGFAQETADSDSGDFLAHSTLTGDGLGEETGPSYSGDFLTRSTLTGDWLGVRNELAAKGVTFDANVTQIEQGVVGRGTGIRLAVRSRDHTRRIGGAGADRH
jgi:hypothetical protein